MLTKHASKVWARWIIDTTKDMQHVAENLMDWALVSEELKMKARKILGKLRDAIEVNDNNEGDNVN